MPDATDDMSLSPATLARRWGKSEKTLSNWRTLGVGPRFVKIGSSVRYSLNDVERIEREGTGPTSGMRPPPRARS